jgi:hypothetical protein
MPAERAFRVDGTYGAVDAEGKSKWKSWNAPSC